MSDEYCCDNCGYARETRGEEIAYGTHYCNLDKCFVNYKPECNDWIPKRNKISETQLLCRATKKLLRRVIKEINEDEKNIYPALLLLHNYIRVTYNDKSHARELRALINGNMWETFKKEVRK